MKLEQVLNEALASFEAYRRLGFPSEEIFFIMDATNVFMVLKTQGKEFTIVCGPRGDLEGNQIIDEWNKRANAWNGTMTTMEREEIWTSSFVANHCGSLIDGLLHKGITLSRQSPTRTPRN